MDIYIYTQKIPNDRFFVLFLKKWGIQSPQTSPAVQSNYLFPKNFVGFQIGSLPTNPPPFQIIVERTKPRILKFLSMRTLTHYPYLLHLGGIFPKCLGRFYSLVRFYHSKLVDFKQGNIHRLVIFFSLITIDLTNKFCKSQVLF